MSDNVKLLLGLLVFLLLLGLIGKMELDVERKRIDKACAQDWTTC